MANDANAGLSSVFQMMGIGDIGGMVNVMRDLMSDKPVEDIEIPPGLQSQALQMVMQRFGAATIEEFLANDEIIERITNAIQEDLREKPAEDTIIFKFVSEMDGEALKALLVENESLQELIEPMIQETIQEQMNETIQGATLENVLAGASAPTEGLPATLLGKNIADLTSEDLVSLSDEQLTQIIPALPENIFKEQVLDKINANLPDDKKVELEGTGYESQLAAFNQAVENAQGLANRENAVGLSGWFYAVTNDEDDVRETIFSTIREEIPGALSGLQEQFPAMAQGQLPEYVTFNNGTYEIDFEQIPPEQIKAFFDANQEDIADMLKQEDNWPMIAQLITRERLIQHKDDILPHILPEMTQDGLSGFRSMMEALPDGLTDIIMDLMGKAIEMLEGFGFNFSAPAPDATRTADPADPAATVAP